MDELYSHSGNKQGEWHSLKEHLNGVADLAEQFASKFDAGSLAKWIGLWHDLGKSNSAFQKYLVACSKGENAQSAPHAIWGAALAYMALKDTGRWQEIALPIAGHHAGLYQPGELSQKIVASLDEHKDLVKTVIETANTLPPLPKCSFPEFTTMEREFFIRMLFSVLVDADYLNTENHFNSDISEKRKIFPMMCELQARFKENQNALLNGTKESSSVNRIRHEVYNACIKAAEGSTGIYRLTVPTGGGKTRSSLGFALEQAVDKKMKHIVFAIPYTSIIDQTASEYRKILGYDAVLEHHSLAPVTSDEGQEPEKIALRLATENWEAPIIVTTTVQLFESLFSNKPSRVRKLHNLANSVIIIDEVQALPPEILSPTLDVIKILAAPPYSATIILCTATQPVFEDSHYIDTFTGVVVQDIVPKDMQGNHFSAMRRVSYKHRKEPISWGALAEEIKSLPQVLVVLNTRKDALALIDAIGKEDDLFHLSTLLCGAHRKMVLRNVRRRLKAGLPVKLISTQVIEAGVDIDFPAVYRSIGPLDRIVQAAGRCNREGKLSDHQKGKVIIFEPSEGRAPKGPYKIGLEKARLLLSDNDPEKLHQPEIHQIYFQRLFADIDPDKKRIQGLREQLDFPEVAKKYKLIEQETVPVLINCKSAEKRLKQWKVKPSKATWQRLQPLLVNMFDYEIKRDMGWVEQISLNNKPIDFYRSNGKYDQLKGIVHAFDDPSDLIVSDPEGT